MDSEANEPPAKQERLRTRWTASLDKIFSDLVVEQIQLGNRRNNVFDKKTWNHIRDEFNRQTDLNFNNNQLRKHLDVLRTRYHNIKSAVDQNEFVMDDSCCIGFDLWDPGAQPKPETSKIKDCPIFEQLCTIFADLGADGKYAQSSHYEELDKSVGTNAEFLLTPSPDGGKPLTKTPSSSRFNASSAQNVKKTVIERKRKRPLEAGSCADQSNIRDQEIINEALAKAMLEMVAASKLHVVQGTPSEERYTITNCIKALDQIEGIDDSVYYAALDLFEDANLRETFISLKSDKVRLTWLKGKCGNAASL